MCFRHTEILRRFIKKMMRCFDTLKGTFFALALLGSSLYSCQTDEPLSECILGTWSFNPSPFPCAADIDFNANGTGQLRVADCENTCAFLGGVGGAYYDLSWTLNGNTLSIDFKSTGLACNIPYTYPIEQQVPDKTGSATCSGSNLEMSISPGEIYTLQRP